MVLLLLLIFMLLLVLLLLLPFQPCLLQVKCSSCSRGERALCSRKACEMLDQAQEGRKEAREEAREEASYTAASREGRCGQCQGCQPCRYCITITIDNFPITIIIVIINIIIIVIIVVIIITVLPLRFPVLCEFCKKGLRFQCTKKKFGDCVFLRHSPPKRARLSEVSERARLAGFWSSPQEEPTLQENLAPTLQQNLDTEFGIRVSGDQELGVRRSGGQGIRSPGSQEIGPGRRSETAADDSADYNIKMEPEELEEVAKETVKEAAEVAEDDWTLSLQMEIKKEAVEDVTFVAC